MVVRSRKGTVSNHAWACRMSLVTWKRGRCVSHLNRGGRKRVERGPGGGMVSLGSTGKRAMRLSSRRAMVTQGRRGCHGWMCHKRCQQGPRDRERASCATGNVKAGKAAAWQAEPGEGVGGVGSVTGAGASWKWQ
eukprot:2672916-Rhodomonas_salina.1